MNQEPVEIKRVKLWIVREDGKAVAVYSSHKTALARLNERAGESELIGIELGSDEKGNIAPNILCSFVNNHCLCR